MFNAGNIDRIIGYPVPQDIGWNGNEFAKAVIGKTSAIGKVSQTVTGIHQLLNEPVSRLRVELTKVSANSLHRDDRVLEPDYSNHSAGGGPS